MKKLYVTLLAVVEVPDFTDELTSCGSVGHLSFNYLTIQGVLSGPRDFFLRDAHLEIVDTETEDEYLEKFDNDPAEQWKRYMIEFKRTTGV